MIFNNQKRYQGQQINNIVDRPVLHKKGKQWITIGMSTLALAGLGSVTALNSANASAKVIHHHHINKIAHHNQHRINTKNVTKYAHKLHKKAVKRTHKYQRRNHKPIKNSKKQYNAFRKHTNRRSHKSVKSNRRPATKLGTTRRLLSNSANNQVDHIHFINKSTGAIVGNVKGLQVATVNGKGYAINPNQVPKGYKLANDGTQSFKLDGRNHVVNVIPASVPKNPSHIYIHSPKVRFTGELDLKFNNGTQVVKDIKLPYNIITKNNMVIHDILNSTNPSASIPADYLNKVISNYSTSNFKYDNNVNSKEYDNIVVDPHAKGWTNQNTVFHNHTITLNFNQINDTDTINFIENGKVVKTEHKTGHQGNAFNVNNDVPAHNKATSNTQFNYDDNTHNVDITPIRDTDTINFVSNGKVIKSEHKSGQQGNQFNVSNDTPSNYKVTGNTQFTYDNQTHTVNITPIDDTDTINFISNGKVVKSEKKTGQQDNTFNVNKDVPAHYNIAGNTQFKYDNQTHSVNVTPIKDTMSIDYIDSKTGQQIGNSRQITGNDASQFNINDYTNTQSLPNDYYLDTAQYPNGVISGNTNQFVNGKVIKVAINKKAPAQKTDTIEFMYGTQLIKEETKKGNVGATFDVSSDVPSQYNEHSNTQFMYDGNIHYVQLGIALPASSASSTNSCVCKPTTNNYNGSTINNNGNNDGNTTNNNYNSYTYNSNTYINYNYSNGGSSTSTTTNSTKGGSTTNTSTANNSTSHNSSTNNSTANSTSSSTNTSNTSNQSNHSTNTSNNSNNTSNGKTNNNQSNTSNTSNNSSKSNNTNNSSANSNNKNNNQSNASNNSTNQSNQSNNSSSSKINNNSNASNNSSSNQASNMSNSDNSNSNQNSDNTSSNSNNSNSDSSDDNSTTSDTSDIPYTPNFTPNTINSGSNQSSNSTNSASNAIPNYVPQSNQSNQSQNSTSNQSNGMSNSSNSNMISSNSQSNSNQSNNRAIPASKGNKSMSASDNSQRSNGNNKVTSNKSNGTNSSNNKASNAGNNKNTATKGGNDNKGTGNGNKLSGNHKSGKNGNDTGNGKSKSSNTYKSGSNRSGVKNHQGNSSNSNKGNQSNDGTNPVISSKSGANHHVPDFLPNHSGNTAHASTVTHHGNSNNKDNRAAGNSHYASPSSNYSNGNDMVGEAMSGNRANSNSNQSSNANPSNYGNASSASNNNVSSNSNSSNNTSSASQSYPYQNPFEHGIYDGMHGNNQPSQQGDYPSNPVDYGVGKNASNQLRQNHPQLINKLPQTNEKSNQSIKYIIFILVVLGIISFAGAKELERRDKENA